jgi:crotonobetainyl-CoA:carnitine CoA-transferase CaiB-like acyl-CoA transferase
LFEGLKVIDCASFVAAPAAATLMADFGADVIKLEPPEGDAYRWSYRVPGQPVPEHNHFWIIGSRNKRGLALDLKTVEGLRILQRLLDTAEVFITSLPLSVRRRLKIRYEDVSPERPRLICASFTAYGETGPEVDKAGFDTTSLLGAFRPHRPDACGPRRGTALPNQRHGRQSCRGNALRRAIVSAPYRRQRTGLGGQVSFSLLAGGLWANSLMVQAKLCSTRTRIGFEPLPDLDTAGFVLSGEIEVHHPVSL